MRKIFCLVLVLALTVALGSLALAETRTHENKKLSIGGTYHKSPIGVNLNYLTAQWDENGFRVLKYQMATWKGIFTLNDVYVVNDGKVLYKRSSERKLGWEFSYTDLTNGKYAFDTIFLSEPVPGFTFAKGEIWWLISYEDKGETKDIVLVWKIVDNSIDWQIYKK